MLNPMSKRPCSFVRSSTGYRMKRPSVSASACIVTLLKSNRLFASVNDEPLPRSAETPWALPLDVTDTWGVLRRIVGSCDECGPAASNLQCKDRRLAAFAMRLQLEALPKQGLYHLREIGVCRVFRHRGGYV